MRKLETRLHPIQLVASLTAGIAACAGSRQPGVTPTPYASARVESVAAGVPNLYDAQRQVDQYIQSGHYDEDVAKVVAAARGWLDQRAKTARGRGTQAARRNGAQPAGTGVPDGYTIVLALGDQESDLRGGYAERTFKLPNPVYYLP